MIEMVEAHLMNVQREIKTLGDRKVAIDQEIEKLTEYLKAGAQELDSQKAMTTVKMQDPTVKMQAKDSAYPPYFH
jgi:hypothetical protein